MKPTREADNMNVHLDKPLAESAIASLTHRADCDLLKPHNIVLHSETYHIARNCDCKSDHLAVISAEPESRVPDIQWRKLLAITYCGFPALYCDDGELQDNRTHPFIDFKRDSADEIWDAMRRRTTSALQSGATLPNTAGQPNEQNDVVQEGKQ